MWDPQHLTTLWASTACFGDSLTFTLPCFSVQWFPVQAQLPVSGILYLRITYITGFIVPKVVSEQDHRWSSPKYPSIKGMKKRPKAHILLYNVISSCSFYFDELGPLFCFKLELIWKAVAYESLYGDQSVAKPLSAQDNTKLEEKQSGIYRVGFEPTIPLFERAKTCRAFYKMTIL
jgi:hypothetical protein